MDHCRQFFQGLEYEFELCWIPAGTSGSVPLFGVSDYLAALALLLVIYTISDYRAKLRLQTASVPVYRVAFWIFLGAFGAKTTVGTWFHFALPLPPLPCFDNEALYDFLIMILPIGTIFYWVFTSFVSPPKFSNRNSHRFFEFYRRVAHNGTREELRIALHELARSAKSIVETAPLPKSYENNAATLSEAEKVAHDFLLLLGNRRICSELAVSAPDTAAVFFREVFEQGKAELPFGTFAQNVAEEFLTNKSSPIFHEDSGWRSGWSGYAQLYSKEIFGNPELIAALARQHSSPFDVHYQTVDRWDAENWEAYTRVALLFTEQLIKDVPHHLDGTSVYQIFEKCKNMSRGAYKLDGADSALHLMDEFRQLQVLSRFVRDLIELLDKYEAPIHSSLKPKARFPNGFHEKLAQFIFEVIRDVAAVRKPVWTCWMVTHNTIWTDIFRLHDGATERWVFRRVTRLIYDEIRRMEKFAHFGGAAYLGFCINVLGLSLERKGDFRNEEAPLRLFVSRWVKAHYARLREESPHVAEACLHGSVTFEETTLEFVRTYDNSLGKGPKEVRFKVDPA